MKTPQEQAIEVADELAQASKANLSGNHKETDAHLETAGALIADLIEELGDLPGPFQVAQQGDAQELPTH